jgi:hypothetical protein
MERVAGRKRKPEQPPRRSNRIEKTADDEGRPRRKEFDENIPLHEKLYDGYETERMERTLKKLTNYPVGDIYRTAAQIHAVQKVRDAVNEHKRKSMGGGDPCYDTFDKSGSSVYLYALPVNLVRGLIQGFKTENAKKHFKSKSATLASHTGTKYLFLHWPKGVEEAFGDWTKHPFIRQLPDLETTIKSLGNWVREKVILNKLLTSYQPGILANKSVSFEEFTHEPKVEGKKKKQVTDEPTKKMPECSGVASQKKTCATEETISSSDGEDGNHARGPGRTRHAPNKFTDYQPPHWDFTGWRFVAARDMPWILHVPLCQEGMMLHVWPTERDPETHQDEKERLKIGTPRYIHVAFGDALLLRADVAHGGCFGSQGNSRFHMVLRREEGECYLGTNDLHMVDWTVEHSEFRKARKKLDELGLPAKIFDKAVAEGKKTVTAYKRRIMACYPCHPTWATGLFDNVHFGDNKK